jgi:hypothetical protein
MMNTNTLHSGTKLSIFSGCPALYSILIYFPFYQAAFLPFHSKNPFPIQERIICRKAKHSVLPSGILCHVRIEIQFRRWYGQQLMLALLAGLLVAIGME